MIWGIKGSGGKTLYATVGARERVREGEQDMRYIYDSIDRIDELGIGFHETPDGEELTASRLLDALMVWEQQILSETRDTGIHFVKADLLSDVYLTIRIKTDGETGAVSSAGISLVYNPPDASPEDVSPENRDVSLDEVRRQALRLGYALEPLKQGQLVEVKDAEPPPGMARVIERRTRADDPSSRRPELRQPRPVPREKLHVEPTRPGAELARRLATDPNMCRYCGNPVRGDEDAVIYNGKRVHANCFKKEG